RTSKGSALGLSLLARALSFGPDVLRELDGASECRERDARRILFCPFDEVLGALERRVIIPRDRPHDGSPAAVSGSTAAGLVAAAAGRRPAGARRWRVAAGRGRRAR